MEKEYDQSENEQSGGGKSEFINDETPNKSKLISDETLNKISAWTFENLPAVIAIVTAALLPHVVGFVTGLSIYALIMYYKNGGKDKNEQDDAQS
ncbi:hypothetical protein FACS189487_00140 [Campylobacterota bacterium]|nr:hypothetical protein FACS189487_00140 [Campylobacterota bacterium]